MPGETQVQTNDRPASPREKLLTLRALYRERGDGFDENLHRRVINADYRERGYGAEMLLQENVPNPQDFPEDPRIGRAVRMNDERAMAIIKDERAALQDSLAEENFREREQEALRRENQALKDQLAELTGARADGTYIPPSQNPLDRSPQIPGQPDPNIHTMNQIRQWGLERQLELHPRWKNTTKKEVLAYFLEQLDNPQREPFEPAPPPRPEEEPTRAPVDLVNDRDDAPNPALSSVVPAF